MNKIFKVIWNHSRNELVVTSELSRGHAKASNSGTDADATAARESISVGLSKGSTLGLLGATLIAATGAFTVSDAKAVTSSTQLDSTGVYAGVILLRKH